MEELKPLSDVFSPDPRMAAFVTIDRVTGDFIPVSLAGYHQSLSEIQLTEQVPTDVRDFFETVKNLCLYAWFVYPFFASTVFLSYTAVELALRLRLHPSAGTHVPGLKVLLAQALAEGLITDDGFSSIREHASYPERSGIDSATSGPESGARYTKILLETMPFLRNAFAHPASNTILTPGDAVSSLRRASELINQLFAEQ